MKNIVVGVDMGGTNTVYALVDETGVIHGSGSFPTDKNPTFDDYLVELRDGILDLSQKLDFPHKILGIGVGAPNGNYYSGCIDNAVNLIWPGMLPMADKLKMMFGGIPVVLTNDANAAALGELIYGGAKGMKDFITVTLGTGLGSGFVVNGDVLYGHDGFAGEFGHVTYCRNGRKCVCGRNGCGETYVSARGVKRNAFELMASEHIPSVLRSFTYENLTSKDVAIAAEKGDKLALKVFEMTGRILGEMIADLVSITVPEAIFLFGGVARAGDLILNPTKKAMEENLLFMWKGKIKLLISGLDEESSAILGASALAWKEINK